MDETTFTLIIGDLLKGKILNPIFDISCAPHGNNNYIFILHVPNVAHNICQWEIYIRYLS